MLLLKLEVHHCWVTCISDNSFPGQGDTPAERFYNYDQEILCLLQSLPKDNSAIEQTDISVETLIDRNVKNQSTSGIDVNVSMLTKRMSSAGLTATGEGRLKETFVRKLFLILVIKYLPKQKLKF